MSDPLSVTASIAGIVTITVQGISLLCETIDKIRNAPESMSKIRTELEQLRPSLIQLDSALKENRPGLILGPEIQAALNSCRGACFEFNESLMHWTKNSGDGKRSFVDSFKIGVFRQARIQLLEKQLNGGIQILNVTLNTANYLQQARQPVMTKEMGDQMMQNWENMLTKYIVEAEDGRKQVMKLEEDTIRSGEGEDKDIFLRETARQKDIIDAIEMISKEALKKVVFERTRQKIHDVKATDSSIALTGFVNAEGKEMMIEQDISKVNANKYSIAVAGVVNNVDINSLFSNRHQGGM